MSENPLSIDFMERMAPVDSKLEQLLAHQTLPQDEDLVEAQPSPHGKFSKDILVADSEEEKIHTAASFSERLEKPLLFKVGVSLMNDDYNADNNLGIREDAAVAVESLKGGTVFFWIALLLGAFTLLILAADTGLTAWFFSDLILWGAFILLIRKFVNEGLHSFVALIILMVVLVLVPFHREVLRRVLKIRQVANVALINASGSIKAGVKDVGLTAVEVLENPPDAKYWVKLVTSWPAQAAQASSRDRNYNNNFQLALMHIRKGEFDTARVYAQNAIYIYPDRPEAFNLLGGLFEARNNRRKAEKYYRAALALNSSYTPAQKNLDRSTSRPHTPLGIDWGLPVGIEQKTAMK